MPKIPSQLQQAADQVHKNGKPKMIRVRDLLSWFGAQRRGILVISEVRKALKRAKVVTVPDFEVAYIDQRIKLKPLELANSTQSATAVVVQETRPAITESVSPAKLNHNLRHAIWIANLSLSTPYKF